jgi:hypothetical protein
VGDAPAAPVPGPPPTGTRELARHAGGRVAD